MKGSRTSRTAIVLGSALLFLCAEGLSVRAARAEPLLCGVDDPSLGIEQPNLDDEVSPSWTLGRKRVLYIRVRFADQPNEPEAKRDAKRKMAEVDRFFRANSNDALSLKTKITRTYVLPKTNAEYTVQGLTPIRDDALAAALADGKDYRDYDFDVVQFADGPTGFSGTATIGGRGCWPKHTSAGIAIHELGHNLGLHHANAWVTENESVIGPGFHLEYGDDSDTMGPAIGSIFHFNAHHKAALSWIAPEHVQTVTASGGYRIFAHDLRESAAELRALKIPRDGSPNYWVEFRQLLTGNRWLLNGAGLRRASPVINPTGTQLLDTTPGSPKGRPDAAITIGSTFSDEEAGIYVTPVARGDTLSPSLDVVVNVGDHSANQAPSVTIEADTLVTEIQSDVTFSAAASDPDGDELAYHWEFGDGSFGANSATVSASWYQENEYVVRCSVTDMKGGTASDSLVVSVGPVTTFRISGLVTFDGVGLAGVHVHNGLLGSANRGAYTDPDGAYTIAGVETGAHTLIAAKYGYVLEPVGFTNPIVVGPSVEDIDYLAASD